MKRILIIMWVLLIINGRDLLAYKYEITDALGERLGKFDDRLLIMYDMDWKGGGRSVRDYDWGRWVRDFRTDLLIRDSSDGFVQEIKLGRIYTKFTPLTLKKTRFPYNYTEDHQFGFRWRLIPDSWLKRFTLLANRIDLDDLTDKNDSKVDTYFIASRLELNPVEDLDLGFSFVNQHNAYRGSTHSKTGLLSGSIREDDYPVELYIKFMDNSPEDKEGGAAVYEMKVYINGVYYPSLSMKGGFFAQMGSDVSIINNGGDIYSDHIEANGDNYFIYKITLPNNGINVRSVKFVFDIANDYLVQVSPDDSFEEYKSPIILVSDKNVKDYSNRSEKTAYFAYKRGESLYGIDAKFNIFGIDISTEYVLNVRYLQYPNTDGKNYYEQGNAFYIKWLKTFDRLETGGEIFYLDRNYDCSFSVEDDDDNDKKPDIADDDGVNFIEYDDINNNGIKDYNEDFLLFDVEDKGFRDVPDDNNNEVEDDVENDNLPDTPYYLGEKGFNCYVGYMFFENFNNEIGYRLNKKYNEEKAEKIYHKLEYRFYPVDWLETTFRNRLEYIKDNIPNDLVDKKDELLFQDNLVNRFIAILDFDVLKNLILNNKILYRFNINDFSKSGVEDKRKDIEYITVFRLGYDYVPYGIRKLLIRPLYKSLYSYSYYYTKETGKVYKTETIKDYLMFEVIFKFSRNTRILTGYQKAFIRDYIFSYETCEKDSAIFEVAYKGKYWDRDLVVKFGVSYILKDYLENVKEDMNYRKIYLESYFNW